MYYLTFFKTKNESSFINIYDQSIKQPTEHTNKKIIFACLARDCAKNISDNIELMQQIGSYFKQYKIVILENGSIDETKKIIQHFVSVNQNIDLIKFDGHTINTSNHEKTKKRMEKMQMLRNIYIDHIRLLYNDYDYLCVFDIDSNISIDFNGFFKSIKLLCKHDCIVSNTVNNLHIRDPYAFSIDDPYKFVKSHILHDLILKITVNTDPNSKPYKIKSGFGIMALYNLNNIIKNNCNYTGPLYVCEHTNFHQNMNVLFNPAFFIILHE